MDSTYEERGFRRTPRTNICRPPPTAEQPPPEIVLSGWLCFVAHHSANVIFLYTAMAHTPGDKKEEIDLTTFAYQEINAFDKAEALETLRRLICEREFMNF